MRTAVGYFIGSDVLRALLTLEEYHTTHNVTQLQFIIDQAGWHADAREVFLKRRIAELQLSVTELKASIAPSPTP